MKAIALTIAGRDFTVQECPHPLDGGDDFGIDQCQGVIWLAPGMSRARRVRVVIAAVSWCWELLIEDRQRHEHNRRDRDPA